MNARPERVIHPFDPVWDADCRVLILGSFPSVKSRENAFYYGHPQNRFWRMLGAVYGVSTPETVEEKQRLLLARHIALWDVLQSCEITGSADSSIRNAVSNDLRGILDACLIDRILLNGRMAEKIYLKYWRDLPLPVLTMPSTSPANAACSLDMLIAAWKSALLYQKYD